MSRFAALVACALLLVSSAALAADDVPAGGQSASDPARGFGPAAAPGAMPEAQERMVGDPAQYRKDLIQGEEADRYRAEVAARKARVLRESAGGSVPARARQGR